MATEWFRSTIGAQATLQRGFDITRKEQRPGRIPVISSGGVSSYHDTSMVRGPGVVIGRKGTLGTVFYVDEDFWPHDTTLWVKDFHGNDPKFVYYYFKSLGVMHLDVGSANPTLNRNHVHPIEVLWPPPREQHAIASILGALDDKIELNRRMNETLEAMARALFKSWFVDFDPVRAKLEGRQPAGMDAAAGALFPDRFIATRVGPVPAGWHLRMLPEAIEVNPPRSLPKGHPTPYLEMSNMPESSARATAWTMREFTSGTKFRNGDVLLARITPCLENGKTAYVDFLQDGQVGWGSTEYIVLHSKPPLPPEFAYFLARSDDFRAHAIRNMSGSSGRQRVPTSCFDAYPIVVPPGDVAHRFGEFAGEAMLTMKAHDAESGTLTGVRDTLLPKLLSGEIRLREAEALVEAAS